MRVGDLFTSANVTTELCSHCAEPSVDCNGRRMHFAQSDTGARTAWEACRTGAQSALF